MEIPEGTIALDTTSSGIQAEGIAVDSATVLIAGA
jgi:hypothetical protein